MCRDRKDQLKGWFKKTTKVSGGAGWYILQKYN